MIRGVRGRRFFPGGCPSRVPEPFLPCEECRVRHPLPPSIPSGERRACPGRLHLAVRNKNQGRTLKDAAMVLSRRLSLDCYLPLSVMVTARFRCTNTLFSESKADAVADTSALPPVNKSAARPWNSVVVVCIVAVHGVVPLQGTNVEKKPVTGVFP